MAQSKPRLSLRIRIGTYLLGAAKGIAFLHSKDIIHRDLKSANLLLTRPKDGRVVVCDFALSRLSSHALTQAGLGTPGWIAPEAWLGDPVSTSSDVYGFAMVMFEILTATLPLDSFKVGSEAQLTTIQYKMCAENLRPPLPKFEPLVEFFTGKKSSAAAAEGSVAPVPPALLEKQAEPPPPPQKQGEQQLGLQTQVLSEEGLMNAVLEEYCGLMRECWQRDPRARPLFPQIIATLEAMARRLL